MIKKSIFLGMFIIIFNIFAEENFQTDQEAKKVNKELLDYKNQLSEKLEEAAVLKSKNASEKEFEKLFYEVKEIKKKIKGLQESFRKESVLDSTKTEEGYAFWDQGESTISQLVMEYGSQDYLYIIPQELASLKINLYSTIPIPRQSWDEVLEFILSNNGIGIKKINPFLRQLYIFKHDPSYIEAVVSKAEDLLLVKDGANICFIFSPKPEELKTAQGFLERFSDLKQTTVHGIRTNILVIGTKETIERLINLYDAVFNHSEGKIVKVISLYKISALEAEKILQAFFSQNQKIRPSFYQAALDELTIIPQGASIVLIGDSSLVDKAQKIILDLEKQLDDPTEMTIFWYTCKHSDPQDLAEVLEKIYFSMTGISISGKQEERPMHSEMQASPKYESNLPVKPKFFEPGTISSMKDKHTHSAGSFIVDAKTGSLLMVVRKEDLTKLKDLLNKLDVPKKMVQIDVLLVERKIQDRKQTGINLLKIGSASNKKQTSLSFEDSSRRKGILDFILSRPKAKLPAFDLSLSFLMAQDDMRIADCPSILAINQTPATISIVEEVSINNGALQIDTPSGPKIEKSFTRAQFGTTIVMTPIIHIDENENNQAFVTLQTDVSFDTHQSKDNDKPNVTRRHIENEVRVADEETIILGGLRRKTSEEGSEKIPFLGEIPGICKLFGTTKKAFSSSEMFIFITPHIIKDPKINFEKQRKFDLQKRQGDTDEFMQKLNDAKLQERKRLFEQSLKLFF